MSTTILFNFRDACDWEAWHDPNLLHRAKPKRARKKKKKKKEKEVTNGQRKRRRIEWNIDAKLFNLATWRKRRCRLVVPPYATFHHLPKRTLYPSPPSSSSSSYSRSNTIPILNGDVFFSFFYHRYSNSNYSFDLEIHHSHIWETLNFVSDYSF